MTSLSKEKGETSKTLPFRITILRDLEALKDNLAQDRTQVQRWRRNLVLLTEED